MQRMTASLFEPFAETIRLEKAIQAELATLIKLGVRLGTAIRELITIVHPRTFARWIAEAKAGSKEKKARGRPWKPEETRRLVIGTSTGRVS